MKPISHEEIQTLALTEFESTHRHKPRVSGHVRLMFSGMDEGQIVMGDGQALDLSQDGLGVLANQSVKPGMEIALFLELANSDDHLCIPEARVSWVNGLRFGVSVRSMNIDDRQKLCNFLHAHTESTDSSTC
jgi:PilZ domain